MPANLLPAVAVLGLGAMGHGIAQTFAAAGHLVRCYDYPPERILQRRQRRDALFLALSKLLYPDSVGGAA